MYDVHKIRPKVRAIIDANERSGDGWKDAVPFPIVIRSIKKVEHVYLKAQNVYIINGVPYTPEELKKMLTIRNYNLPIRDTYALPPDFKDTSVKSLLNVMNEDLFPFVQYDNNTHFFYIWALDEDGFAYEFAEISIPFFYYEYDMFRLIILSMPDRERMTELWTAMVREAKRGYYYKIGKKGLWKLVNVGADVLRGNGKFRGKKNEFYLYTIRDIENPAAKGEEEYRPNFNRVFETIGDNAVATKVHTEAEKVNTSNIPHVQPKFTTRMEYVSYATFMKYITTQPYNLGHKWKDNYDDVAFEKLSNPATPILFTWINDDYKWIVPLTTDYNFSKLTYLKATMNIEFIRKCFFHTIKAPNPENNLYLLPFTPILKNLKIEGDFYKYAESNYEGEFPKSEDSMIQALSGISTKPDFVNSIFTIPPNPMYLSIIQHVPFSPYYYVATREGYVRVGSVKAEEIVKTLSKYVENTQKPLNYASEHEYTTAYANIAHPRKVEKPDISDYKQNVKATRGEEVEKVRQVAREEIKKTNEEMDIGSLLEQTPGPTQLKKLIKLYFSGYSDKIPLMSILKKGRNIILNDMQTTLAMEMTIDGMVVKKDQSVPEISLLEYVARFRQNLRDVFEDYGISADYLNAHPNLVVLYERLLSDHELERLSFGKQYKDTVREAEKEFVIKNSISQAINSRIKNIASQMLSSLKENGLSISVDRFAVNTYTGIIVFLLINSLLFNDLLTAESIKDFYAVINRDIIKDTRLYEDLKNYFEKIDNSELENVDKMFIANFISQLEKSFAYQVGVYIAESRGNKHEETFFNPYYKPTDSIYFEWGIDAIMETDNGVSDLKKTLIATLCDKRIRYSVFDFSPPDLQSLGINEMALLTGIIDGITLGSDTEKSMQNELYTHAIEGGFDELKELLEPNSEFVKNYSIYEPIT